MNKSLHCHRLYSGFLLFLSALLAAGCGSHPVSSGSTIVITSASTSIAAGQTSQLTATEQDSGGQTNDVTSQVTWASSNAAVATVSTHGLLTGASAGTSSISATLGSVSGKFTVTISKAVATRLTITPTSPQLYTGASQQFAATVILSDGSTQNVSSAVTWSVTPTSAATINSTGLLQTVAAGPFTVKAISGNLSASVSGAITDPTLESIAVSPASANIGSNGTQQFVATGTYNDQSSRDLTNNVTWTSSNTALLTINSSGLATASTVTATTPVTITAQLNSLTASAAVNVTPQATVQSLVVTPTSSSLAQGTAQQNSATAFYSDGTRHDVTQQVTWSVVPATPNGFAHSKSKFGSPQPRDTTNGEVSVNQSGVSFASAVGAGNIQATFGAVSAQSVMLVRNTTAAMISISTSSYVLPAGSTQQLLLKGWFTDGSTQDLSLTANWLSSNPAVATIDPQGLVTAVGPGTAQFSASYGGLAATPVTLQVLPTELVSLTLQVPNPVDYVGGAQQLKVIGTYSNGSSFDLTSLATFQSSSSTTFQVSNSGFLQTLAAGRAQVTATVNGFSTVTTVQGVDTKVVSLIVLPAYPVFAIGTSLQFTALAVLSNGAVFDATSLAIWTSNDPSILTIDTAGLAKSGSIGSTTVTASLDGITQVSAVSRVTNATLSSLSVTPGSARLAASTHAQFTATGFFSDGSVEDLTNDVLWSLGNATVASIDDNGTLLGISPGSTTLTALSQSKTATMPITVTNATLVSTVISPGNFELPVSVQNQLALIGNFSDGTTQDMTADAIWISPTPAIAFAFQTGVGVGLTPGIGTISAQLGNFTSATQVNVTDATITSVSLTPPDNTIRQFGSQQLTAIGTFSDGFQQNLYLNVVFAPADPTVLYLRANGLAIGENTGSTPVIATYRNLQATCNFQVLSGTLTSITLTPANLAVTAGAASQFTATGTYADGTTQNLSSQVTWTSSNPAVLSVDRNGLATAHATSSPATVTVTAQSGSTTQTFMVAVSPSSATGTITDLTSQPLASTITQGSVRQFSVIATYSSGAAADVSGIATWTSSNPAVATVNSSGLATAIGVGGAIVTASLNGVSTTSTIDVENAPAPNSTLRSIAVTPSSNALMAGASQQFIATGTYSDGTIADISSAVTWQSSTANVATVSSAGTALGLTPGATTISAQLSGVAGTATLTVNASATGITKITVSPVNATIGLHGTQQYSAVATYSDNSTQNVSSTVTWSSSASAVASISNAGVATGVAAGSTAIAAALGGVSGTASLTVTGNNAPGGNPLTAITVAPASSSITVGTNQQYTATGTYSDGTTGNITGAASWSSSAPATATITSGGLATGANAGTARIIAQNGPLSGWASLTVTASAATLTSLAVTPTSSQMIAGLSQQFAATGAYSDGTARDLSSSATWTTSYAQVATVNSSGEVTGVAPGTSTITASSGSFQSQTTVIIRSATLQSLAVSPSGASFAAGSQQQLTLTGTYSNGSHVDLTSVANWSSLATSVATVSNNGLVTGSAPGTARISASFQSQSATTTVQITPAALVSVAITPSPVQFAKGTSQQFTVVGTYSDGTTHNVTSQATYLGSNSSVLTVSSTGLATGVTAGTATVSVSDQGVSATAQNITITPATLMSIAITPANPRFANGTSQQFTAIGTFSDGRSQDLSNQVVWSSSSPQTATINNNGLASSGAPGSTQISATFGGVTGTSGTAKVTSAAVTSIAVTPANSQIAKGTTQQFTVTGTFSDGTTQNLSNQATWSTSNPAVASVDENGLATGIAVGSGQISAAFGNMTASTSSFQVNAATLLSISFSPTSPTLARGTSIQETVTGTFSDGSTQNLTGQAMFSSSNPSSVAANGSGLLTAVAPGSSTVTVSIYGVTSSFTATATNATLSSITITPSNPSSFAKGTTEQFTATGQFSDGSTQNISSTVAWSTSNASVITVDSNGLATGAGTGSASVSAAWQGESATTPPVTVSPAVVASIIATPAGISITTGSTQQYSANATYTDATNADVTSSAAWSSTSLSVATISPAGLAAALAPGSTTIAAQLNGVTGSTGLTVTSVISPTLTSITVTPSSATIARGNTQQFTATGTYSDGTTQNITSQATWASSSTAVATISSQGLATGVNGGNSQITAAYQGSSGVATLNVSSATLVSISVTPSATSIAAGTDQQYQAVGTLSDGSTQNLTSSVAWSSSNNSVAAINTSGLAHASSSGAATITAQAGSTSGTATLTVSSATAVSVQVMPAAVYLPIGGMQQFAVTAVFSDGSSQNVTNSATYGSGNTGVANVNLIGNVTATGAGTTSLTVSQGSASTTVPVAVTSATLTSVTVSPSTLTLPVGGSEQMTATGTYSDGSTENLTNSVVWSSSAPTVATVSTTGKVQVNQTGAASITATSGLTSGTSSVTGTSAVITNIVVSPAGVTLGVGQTQQYTATATLSDGTQQNVTSSANWSTSDTTKGTISNVSGSNGLLLATGAGALTVTATMNSISGSANATVTNAALTSLTITPNPVSLPAGTTQQLTVTGNYSDGSSANVTASSTWSSSNAAVASVSTSGVLNAASTGTATITATDGLQTKTDAVTVTNATLSSITISPANSTAPLGVQSQLTATGTYSDGSTANLTSQVQWSSSAPAVATVSSSGLVSTLTAGSTQINASFNSVIAQTQFTVSAAVLEGISVQATQSSFALGLSLQLTAIGTYSDSSTRNITSLVSWSSQTPTVGVVSSTGVATGVTAGAFQAQAAMSGVTGSLSLTVTNAVLQSIVITPNNPTIVNVLGNPTQFTATGHYSDGTTQNITNSCHWAITSGLAVGSISQTGSFSALGVGTGTLSATSGAISATDSFTVVSIGL